MPRRRRAGRVPVPRPRAVGPDRLHLRRLERRRGGRRLRRAARRGGAPVRGADRRGRGGHPDHPGRRERLGALRGRRPAVPARALRAAVGAPRAADRHDGARRARRADRDAGRHLSRARGSTPTSTSGSATPTTIAPGVSWPTRGRRSTAAGRSTPRRRRGRAKSCSSPKAATGSGGTATTIRRSTTSSSTTCSGGTCGTSTGCWSKPVPDELFVSNISAGAPPPTETPADRAAGADAGRRRDELLRVARRRPPRGPRRRPGRCTRATGAPPVLSAPAVRVRPRAAVRPARRRAAAGRTCWPTGYEFALTFLQPAGRAVLGPARSSAASRGAFGDRRSPRRTGCRAGPGGAAVAAGTDPRAVDAAGRHRA